MTSYLVLCRGEVTGGHWRELDTISAHSANEAVRKGFLKHPGDYSAVVAVPARSWRPTPIRLEKTERVVLGDVAPASQPEGAGATPEEEA